MQMYKFYGQHPKFGRNKRKRIRRTNLCLMGMAVALVLLIIYLVISIGLLIYKTLEYQEDVPLDTKEEQELVLETEHQEDVMGRLETFAKQNHILMEEYPEELLGLLEKNPETEEFVFQYPLKKDTYETDALDAYLNQSQMPLFLQWDSRWGYFPYGDKPLGMTGCGPTCLSMVALHLLQNPEMTPVYMADFAERNGYYVRGTGTAWALMTEGAGQLGLRAKEVSLDEELVFRYLSQGRPIISAMGPGDFTEHGHFIVFTGIKDGKIVVNDPNSKMRSEMLWDFEDIKYQIKNMWVYNVI